MVAMKSVQSVVGVVVGAVLSLGVLAGCVSHDPFASEGADGGAPGGPVVIGTANFPESEIIGQVWAAALENAGYEVQVKSGIGSREVYMAALQEGSVDIVPEYSGNLAQFFGAELDPGASEEQVLGTLRGVLPEGIVAGETAAAQSKDAFWVTEDFAQRHNVASLADLADVPVRLRLAGNPELSKRPYGPSGLKELYGVGVDLVPISDGGGPLTIAALNEGTADVADIYTTTPTQGLVQLDDPKGMVLPQNVLPVMRARSVSVGAASVIRDVNIHVTTEALTQMNHRNVGEGKQSAASVAREFVDSVEVAP